MDRSSRRPPPPPPNSKFPPVPPPHRGHAAPPLPRRNQVPPPTKETLDDFYEDMRPPKAVSPAIQRKYTPTHQPIGMLGGLVQHESSDDTYEIPEVNINPEPRLPPRPDTGAKPFARPSPPESDSDDGEWDEEWDDAQTVPAPEDYDLYPVADGGCDGEDPAEQLQQAKVPLTSPNKTDGISIAVALKEKLIQFQNNKLAPKSDKKPQPPEKPVEIKPHLPPRGFEKLPPVPPIDTTNIKSDGKSSEGSSLFSKINRGGLSKIPSILSNHVPPDSEEIYDDATTENLTSFPWYHGELDRKDAEKRVSQLRENGAFLVRASTKADPINPYVLVVISEGRMKNLQIRQRNDKSFAIGNYKEDEVSFNTVPDLVSHHKINNIKLADGGTVMLNRTPQK